MANKAFKFAAIALLGVIGLTACEDDIYSKPTGYDKDTVIDIQNADIYHNLANIVYDAYHDGALAADVLDKVLYEYSITMLGRYNKVAGNMIDGETTLKEAVAAADSADKTIINKFIKEHKAYWSVNSEGKRVNDEGVEVADDAVASAREIARVKAKWDSIEERIAKAMYDKISGGSYSEKSLFYETRLLKALKYDMKKVKDYVGATVNDGKLLSPDIEPKDVFDNFLNRENYQPNYGLTANEANNEITYIEDEVVPTIYRSLLTEQYILDKTYNTLGRASARKINVISISNNDNYDMAAPYLMKNLVKKINEKGSDITLDTFKQYANIWKGVDVNTADPIVASLISSGAFETATSKDGEAYIKGTKYGDMIENYDKIDDDPLLSDVTVEADFTGSNTYSKELGKTYKTNDIKLTDYTTTGWYTKSSGVSSLPSFITTRLFNIGVASALDRSDNTDRWDTTTDKYDATKDYNAYVAKINGKYYLKNDTAEQGDVENDVLFYDRDSKTYYVVQIEEAVNATKLSKTSNKNYESLRNAAEMEAIVNDVLEIVASGDSYDSLSKKHWLSEMELKYHDTVVYEYFKSNFPDLFED